jgi:prepilin-type N-terminal cleavage/methylation domain-containing protein
MQRGVTLVELLVSMLILSAVMALVTQAVGQVERIVRVADESQRATAERWGAGWALQSVFANLVAPVEATGAPFSGSADRIQGYSTTAVLDASDGVRQFELNLRPAADGAGGVELQYRELGSSRDVPSASGVVANFTGAAEFSYRNRAGQWFAVWPPAGSATEGDVAERLPSAVRVAEAGGRALFITYPVLASGSYQRGDPKSPFGNGSR